MGIIPLILALPLLELAAFIALGRYIGPGGVIAEILLSGALGIALLRREGQDAMARLRGSFSGQAGMMTLDGAAALRFLPGLLLTLPGVLTDLLGLALLVPPLRRGLGAWILRRAGARFMRRTEGGTDWNAPASGGSKVVDADYSIVETEEPKVPPERRLH